MGSFKDTFQGWPAGVISSGRPERNPRTSAFHGRNNLLSNLNTTGATPRTRNTFKLEVDHQTHNGKIIAINDYMVIDDGSAAPVVNRVYFGDDGSIGQFFAEGFDPVELGIAGTLNGTVIPSVAIANDLLFIVDGTARKKMWGASLWNFGITRPTEPPTPAVGAAGNMTGTFEIRTTFVNGTTGEESSASDSSNQITVSSQKISLSNVKISADVQVTARRIYIREVNSQTLFRLADTIADNVSLTHTLDVVDYTLLDVLGPDTVENDPPPVGVKYLAYVNGYMFAADDYNLFWSKQGSPASFDSTFEGEPIGSGDGQKLTGLYGFGDVLLVFKTRSVYMLSGSTPSTWKVVPMFPDIGSLASRSLVAAGGYLWWWSHLGPVRWNGGQVEQLGKLLLNIPQYNAPTNIQGAYDELENLVIFTHPGVAGEALERNTEMVVFNAERGIVVSDKWDGLDVCSLNSFTDITVGVDVTLFEKRRIFVAGYAGQVFSLQSEVDVDGVPSGTTSGTFTASGTSLTSISGTGFYTGADVGLAERYVTIIDADKQLVARVRIESNTSTALTLADSVTVVNGASYRYYIGAPNFEWHTAIEDGDDTFFNKKYQKAFIAMEVNAGVNENTEVVINTYTNVDEEDLPAPTATKVFSIVPEDTDKIIRKRFDVEKVGQSWMQVISSREVGSQLTILGVGMRGETLSEKMG